MGKLLERVWAKDRQGCVDGKWWQRSGGRPVRERDRASRVTAQPPVSQGDPRGSRCPEDKPDGPRGVDGLWWTHRRAAGPLSGDVGP